MNERIKSLRDKAYRDPELQEQLQTSGHYFAFVEGFQLGYDLRREEMRMLANALKTYQSMYSKQSDLDAADEVLAKYYSKYGDKV